MSNSEHPHGMRHQGAYDEDDTAALLVAFEKGLILIGQVVEIDTGIQRKLACAVLHTFTSCAFRSADELAALSVSRVLGAASAADVAV